MTDTAGRKGGTIHGKRSRVELCAALDRAEARAEAAEAERDRQYDENVHRITEQAKAEAERDALAAKLALAVEALEKLHHAVCGETGFSECVRRDSGKVYPWPALDIADSLAQTALAQLTAAPKEGKDDDQ